MGVQDRDFQEQKSSEQAILNRSFDREFSLQVVEIAGYDPGSDAMNRIVVDSSGRLVISIASAIPLTLTPGSVVTLTPTTSFLEYDSIVTVPDNSLATIISHLVASTTLLLDGVIATGTVDAEYTVLIDSVVKIKYRTSEQERSVKLEFSTPQKISVGSILEVKVIHYETALTADFDATLVGHKD